MGKSGIQNFVTFKENTLLKDQVTNLKNSKVTKNQLKNEFPFTLNILVVPNNLIHYPFIR